MDIHNCILGNRIAYWNYCNLLYGNILGIHLPFTHALKAFDKVKMAARQEVLGVAGEALQAMLIDDDFEDVGQLVQATNAAFAPRPGTSGWWQLNRN